MATQGAAVSLVELGEYEKASTYLEKLVKVSQLFAPSRVILDNREAYEIIDPDAGNP